MRKIFVPTDGSLVAIKALSIALDLAEKHDAKLYLFHALLNDKEPEELMRLQILENRSDINSELDRISREPKASKPVEAIMTNPILPERPTPNSLLIEIGEEILVDARKASEDRNIPCEVLDISEQPASRAIIETVKNIHADMIVMGMRGLRQIEAMTFGSVSQDVCRATDCTCVVVH